jgi:glycosyltransferase involved in cell wall biosynthesis
MSHLYSIVATCRGRLRFLLQTLPSLLAQPDTEVVVVDYACPEDTARVVAERFPAAVIVKVEGASSFHLADARNIGARAASGETLIFVDADIVIAPDFVARIDAQMREDVFFHFPLSETIRGWSGTCVVPKRHFDRIEGYDDLINGYGGDDLDLYFRLSQVPLEALPLDPSYIAEILHHSTESRTAH